MKQRSNELIKVIKKFASYAWKTEIGLIGTATSSDECSYITVQRGEVMLVLLRKNGRSENIDYVQFLHPKHGIIWTAWDKVQFEEYLRYVGQT